MGGFTVNGCGAADSYYPIKDLHTAHCPSCGRDRMFALMELKRKVKVFYVPTFSLSSRYAVVCKQCKDGWYVSDQQKEFILSHPADCVRIDREGVHFEGMEGSVPVAEPAAPPAPQIPAAPAPAKVCTCGQELPSHAIFCSQCGKRWEAPKQERPAVSQRTPSIEPQPVPEAPKAASVDILAAMRKKKICPACRMMFPMERQNCPICDALLEERK